MYPISQIKNKEYKATENDFGLLLVTDGITLAFYTLKNGQQALKMIYPERMYITGLFKKKTHYEGSHYGIRIKLRLKNGIATIE